MGFHGKGSGMVWHNKNGIFLACCRKSLQQRTYNLLVNPFNGPNLTLNISVMAAFIWRLHMDIDQILSAQQSFQRSLSFSPEIGVNVSCGSFHFNNFHSCTDTDSLDEIHCRDHRSLDPICRLKTGHGRTGPLSPQPDGIGRIQPFLFSCLIHRMIF